MSADPLPYGAALEEYQREADALFQGLKSGTDDARWRFKWEHPRFRGKSVDEVDAATLDVDDARIVIAHQYGFQSWAHLVAFTEAVMRDKAVAQFEAAVEAVVAGNVTELQSMLSMNPELVHARSTRRHHATLLHYVAANGVEGGRQKTPQNAIDVAKTLLDAGADVDALADMYDARCTTMSMLVSSSHPAAAGLQTALAETLLDYGAAFVGPGSNWQSTLMTALAFGFLTTAQALARRGAPVDNVAAAAGLGRVEDVARMLPGSNNHTKHIALALAAQYGHVDVLRMLLDAGEDPNRYNPEGYHSHSTPLHQAVWSDCAEVVCLLVERGARLDIRDTLYSATPLDWAIYGGRTRITAYLRERGSPAT